MVNRIGLISTIVSWLDKASVIFLGGFAIFCGIYFFDITIELEEEAWREAHLGAPCAFWAEDMIHNMEENVWNLVFRTNCPNAMLVHRYLTANNFKLLDRIIFTHKPYTVKPTLPQP